MLLRVFLTKFQRSCLQDSRKPRAMESKIIQYEAFINEKLRADLQHVEKRLEMVVVQLSEYQTLKSMIQKLEDKTLPVKHMRVYTDLGCNFRVQAHIPDPCTMFVNLGLEIFVEMDLDQAAKYVSRRIEGLENAVKTLKNTEYQIKANIRIMLEGLRKMQGLTPEPPDTKKSQALW